MSVKFLRLIVLNYSQVTELIMCVVSAVYHTSAVYSTVYIAHMLHGIRFAKCIHALGHIETVHEKTE